LIYSFDTSSLIEAWQETYAPDVFPSFWRNIEKLIQGGMVVATDEVKLELSQEQDALFKWATAQRNFFIPIALTTPYNRRSPPSWLSIPGW